MSIAVWARKTVALGLAVTLAGPSVALLSAQDAQGERQEEKRARRQQQAEKQQQKQQAREQEQSQRRAQREEQAARRQENAQQDRQQRQRDREQRAEQQQERQAEQQRARQEQREAQAQRRQQSEPPRWQADQAQRDAERRQRRGEQARIEEQARAAEQAQARAAEQVRDDERARESQRVLESQRGAERARPDAWRRQPVPRGDGAVRRGEPISEERRSEAIRENRERTERFSQGWRQRERWGRERAAELQRQRRYAHYRYQERYLDRLRTQWRHDDWRRYDYGHDPYFWSAPAYRYRCSGRYYEINDYGADLLRDAVNRGYEEGFLAGQADREDRWHGDYRDSYVYEDASYGYRGLYVDEQQYAYYFRQGFDRGYADGYNGRYQYGYRDRHDNGLKVLAAVLAGILVFEAIR